MDFRFISLLHNDKVHLFVEKGPTERRSVEFFLISSVRQPAAFILDQSDECGGCGGAAKVGIILFLYTST